MNLLKSKQATTFMMVLFLFLAPFEGLFASLHSQHESQAVMTMTADMMSHFDHDSVGVGATMNADNQQCETDCVNCIFCSAAVPSYQIELDSNRLTQNFHFSIGHIKLITDVDFRPPRNFFS